MPSKAVTVSSQSCRPEGWARNSDRSRFPPGCTMPPLRLLAPAPMSSRSSTMTARPAREISQAVARPVYPPPTTATSTVGRQPHGRRLGQVDLVPPIGPGHVVRGQGCGGRHGARFASGVDLDNTGGRR